MDNIEKFNVLRFSLFVRYNYLSRCKKQEDNYNNLSNAWHLYH